MFEHIVRQLQLSSGIWRTTYPERFSDVDPEVNPLLRELFHDRAIVIQDWAASDCLASAEWAESLWKQMPAARFVASDLLLHLNAISAGSEAFILEPDGKPLQYVRPPFVVSLRDPVPLHYPVNRWLAVRAMRKMQSLEGVLKQCRGLDLPQGELSCPAPWTASRISLVHPRVHRLQAQGAAFAVIRHSVFEVFPEPCDVIRSMNIFIRRYFDDATIERGIATVFDSLHEGGIWIVGRTTEEKHPTRNRASVFQKTGAGFRQLRQLNAGSEIDGLIQQWRLTPGRS